MAFAVTLIHGHGFILGQTSGMIARITCSNAIYQKVFHCHVISLCWCMLPSQGPHVRSSKWSPKNNGSLLIATALCADVYTTHFPTRY